MTVSTFIRPSVDEVPKPFKPQEYLDCAAVVLHPKVKQIAMMNGKSRLEVICTVHVFEDPMDIEDGKPSETIPYVVTWGRIGSVANRAMVDGKALAACIGQGKPHPIHGTKPWILTDLDAETERKLSKWAQTLV